MIPVAETPTLIRATLGEIFAWIIGWDLILEYAVSNMAVAVGSACQRVLDSMFGLHLPALAGPMIVGRSPDSGSTCPPWWCCWC
jgi:APA family basic amino acid/polyamine antiporter